MTSLNWHNKEFLKKESHPQSKPLSSLLANRTFFELETKLKIFVSTKEVQYLILKKCIKNKRKETLLVARYEGNFIILHDNLKIVMGCFGILKDFLKNSGLQFSKNQIFLTHSRYNLKENVKSIIKLSNKPGFNFLGFTFRHFRSKYSLNKKTKGKLLGSKLLVLPSKESIKKHNKKMHEEILEKSKTKSQEQLINRLNTIIFNWVSYFGISDAKSFGILNKLDYLLYLKLRKWSTVGKKVSKKDVQKLWSKKLNAQSWVFCSSTKLLKYSRIQNKNYQSKFY